MIVIAFLFAIASMAFGQDDLRKRKTLDIQFKRVMATATVSWGANTESDLSGYKIYYGSFSGSYDVVQDVRNATSFRVGSLIIGNTYYFAVTAYDFSGNESNFSDEVLYVAVEATIPAKKDYVVPSDGSEIRSFALKLGTMYSVTVSGTFQFWLPNPQEADAGWSQWDVNGILEWQSNSELGLLIDNQSIGTTTFFVNHTYTKEFEGAGVPIVFKILDRYYPDNSGSLFVEVKEL